MNSSLYIFDLDGTLVRGAEALPYAAEVVSELRTRGALIRFLTNNSGSHVSRLHERLLNAGIECGEEEIYSSAIGTGVWLSEHGFSTAFVVGEDDLKRTLGEFNIDCHSEAPESVVVGICRKINYDWINQALQHLRNGAKFVATNSDSTYPLENDRFEPGAGSMVAAVQACSLVEPYVIGKPNPYLVSMILRETGCAPSQTTVIGDRYETDIEAGIAAGCKTLLVTGGSTPIAPKNLEWAHDVRALL